MNVTLGTVDDGSFETDVLIVGSGASGAILAEELAKAGRGLGA